eukprot:COSAG03_NODE_8118_length_835_cov_2.076087_1_plen_227_part_01
MPGQTWRDNGHKALCPLSRVNRLERVLEVLLRLLRRSLLALLKPRAPVARRRGHPVARASTGRRCFAPPRCLSPFRDINLPLRNRAKSRVRNRAKFRARNRAKFRVAQTGHFIEFRANRTVYRFTQNSDTLLGFFDQVSDCPRRQTLSESVWRRAVMSVSILGPVSRPYQIYCLRAQQRVGMGCGSGTCAQVGLLFQREAREHPQFQLHHSLTPYSTVWHSSFAYTS